MRLPASLDQEFVGGLDLLEFLFVEPYALRPQPLTGYGA